jgi:pilus assembly protein Flp/PilA
MAVALITIRAWISSRVRGDDRGASVVEYALLVALIAVVCALAVGALGGTVSSSYSSTGAGFAAN